MSTWTKEEQERHRAELRMLVRAENDQNPRFSIAVNGMKWLTSASCLAVEPETFFPERTDHEGQAAAIAICEQCPVRQACLDDDLKRPVSDQNGIRGGKTAEQRKAIIRARAEEKAA